MKHLGKFFLAIVTLSLLSSGISSAAFAAAEPISVTTNKEWYGDGSTIIISGEVKDFDPSDPMKATDVTVIILAPNGNIVTVAQVPPSSDGSYSTSVKASGMINDAGDYTVKVKWGAQSNDIMFEIGGSTGEAPPEPEEQETTVVEAIDEEPDDEPEPAMTQPICGPGTVLQTQSGSTFMTGFNQFYYSFSPAIADYERENAAFKEAVKITITPMLTSLAILNYVDIDSEEEMLGYGIGIILLNIGMYFVAPAVVIFKIRNRK